MNSLFLTPFFLSLTLSSSLFLKLSLLLSFSLQFSYFLDVVSLSLSAFLRLLLFLNLISLFFRSIFLNILLYVSIFSLCSSSLISKRSIIYSLHTLALVIHPLFTIPRPQPSPVVPLSFRNDNIHKY